MRMLAQGSSEDGAISEERAVCGHVRDIREFTLKKGRRGVSIVVSCPVCGKEGILRRSGIRISGTRYVVVHGHLKCQVPPTHPAQPVMDAIYRSVRER
ncbi:MAG: hypothetical protein ACXQS4_03645 [Methermicoccaceae archaeon]